MDTLNFSNNWNGKLLLDNFSTVRLMDTERFALGNELEILYKRTSLGYAKVAALRKFQYRNITDALAYLDIGKPAHYLAEMLVRFYGKEVKMQPDTMLHHVVLHYTERNFENQQIILKQWWDSKTEGLLINPIN